MGNVLLVAIGAVLAATCSACGGGALDGSQAVAEAFERAVAADDGDAACRFLAPRTRSELEQSAGTPCAQAIVEEDLPEAGVVRGSSAYGTMAQIRFAEDTLFMAEFNHRWRVMAAGCAPVEGSTYHCTLKGG